MAYMNFLLQSLWIKVAAGVKNPAASSAKTTIARLHHGLTPITTLPYRLRVMVRLYVLLLTLPSTKLMKVEQITSMNLASMKSTLSASIRA